MANSVDVIVIVIGLGAHGRAAAHQLAKRGAWAIGMDRRRMAAYFPAGDF